MATDTALIVPWKTATEGSLLGETAASMGSENDETHTTPRATPRHGKSLTKATTEARGQCPWTITRVGTVLIAMVMTGMIQEREDEAETTMNDGS